MSSSPPQVIALTKRSRDYGSHSSYYTQAFAYAPEDGVRISVVAPREGLWSRVVGRMFSASIHAPQRNQTEAAAELSFVTRTSIARRAIGHIANVEDHFPLLAALHRPEPRWVTTVHFPPAQWREEDALNLRRCGKVIVLCQRDAEYFRAIVKPEQIALILHGVDTEFFSPDEVQRSPAPRVIFVGKWLRDFSATASVLQEALARWPDLQADLVVARRWTEGTPLSTLENHPRVHWYDSVSDEDLRRLYRQAWLLLLPLIDTSANNALVEALSCGTVPVVNHVGGVPDYGGGDIFPTAPNTDGLFSLMAGYLDHPERLEPYAKACRKFALERLSWRAIRAQHLNLYRQMAASLTR